MVSTVGIQNLNPSHLQNNGFQFYLKRAPHVNFFVQKTEIPGIELGNIREETPFADLVFEGDHMHFEDLEVTFLVDEDLSGWFELANWLIALGRAKDSAAYAELEKQDDINQLGIRSDILLIIEDNKRNAHVEVVFENAIIDAISGLRMDASPSGVTYMPIQARFSYSTYKINLIPTPANLDTNFTPDQ